MLHRKPRDPTDIAMVSVLFDHTNDIDNDFILELNPRTTNINQPRRKVSFASRLWYNLYGNFIYYNGSMTQPNCDPNVKWFVFTVPQDYSNYYYL